jgi:hypothetical protein
METHNVACYKCEAKPLYSTSFYGPSAFWILIVLNGDYSAVILCQSFEDEMLTSNK